MPNELEPTQQHGPICGFLSVTAPVLSVACAFIGDKVSRLIYPGDDGRLFAVAFVGLPLIVGLIAGTILAGAAARREERWSALRWIGFLVNAGPLVYILIASSM
jgi:hypothetical protein